MALSDGSKEAWHTNVERRPDGSVLAGWDLGQGGMANTVMVADGKDGTWGSTRDLSEGRWWGERPHFAFDQGDHVVWFHREHDRPLHVYYRGPRGDAELNRGLGGYHYDPDIAVNAQGVLCAVWGWDGGSQAELVYSLNKGEGWSRPAMVAQLRSDKPGLPSIAVTEDGSFHVVWAQWKRGESAIWYARLDD